MRRIGRSNSRSLGVLLSILLSLASTSNLAGEQDRFSGSVPDKGPAVADLGLSFNEAIARAIRNNLGTVLAGEDVRAARAVRLQAMGQLEPLVYATAGETSQQINLAAFGFKGFTNTPSVVGPFGLSDARLQVSQPVLNFSAIYNRRAANLSFQAAGLSQADARDTVVLIVAGLYLDTLAGAARVDSAEAQVASAEAVYKQAVEFKQAGTVPAIEVLRAQVQLQTQRQRVILLRSEQGKQKLRLARAIGLGDGQQFHLTDPMPYGPMPAVGVEEAIAEARATRKDYQSLQARVRSLEWAEKATNARSWPSLAFNGNYGVIGPSFAESHGTYAATLGLTIPLLGLSLKRGAVMQSDVQVQQRRAELQELESRIGFEVRTAFLDLTASRDQVEVARSSIDLAKQQLEQARDRFAAGVSTNLEVVQAQDALALSNESYISSLHAYNAAKAVLARVIGGAEKGVAMFLQGVQQP